MANALCPETIQCFEAISTFVKLIIISDLLVHLISLRDQFGHMVGKHLFLIQPFIFITSALSTPRTASILDLDFEQVFKYYNFHLK